MPNKLRTFFVEFDNPAAVYYAGQVINGRVLVVLNEPMKMRGIRLNFTGRAYTHWTETRTHTSSSGERTSTHTERVSFSDSYTNSSGRSTSKSETYSDSAVYVNTQVTLWGKPEGASGDNPFMQPGSYQLPFSFILPPNCPSSFEGTWGHIRYVCKAIIDKPWKFNHTTKRPLTVIALVDLNLFANLHLPLTVEKVKRLSILGCIKRGTIDCSITIPRSGFVPGEVMQIEMQVVNNSTTKIKEIKICIEECVDFFAEGHTKNFVRNVAQVAKGIVEPGQSQQWKNEGMRLPSMAPTLINCRIIRINYFLHIIVDPAGMHTDLDLRVPITIGNVPLRVVMQELNQMYQQSSSFIQAGTLNPSAPPNPMPNGVYPDLPPPSYQETIYGQTNIKEEGDNEYTMGQVVFTPKYSYYDWPQQTQFSPPINQEQIPPNEHEKI